jgi:hypothetical protein
MRQKSGTGNLPFERLVKDIRRATRKGFVTLLNKECKEAACRLSETRRGCTQDGGTFANAPWC